MIGFLSFIIFLLVLTFLEQRKKSYIPKVRAELSDTYKLEVYLAAKKLYLQSQEWKLKREQVLKQNNYECSACTSKENLHVHHDSGYNLIPDEPISCLRVLCNNCHKKFHEIHGYPKTLQEYYSWNSHNKRV